MTFPFLFLSTDVIVLEKCLSRSYAKHRNTHLEKKQRISPTLQNYSSMLFPIILIIILPLISMKNGKRMNTF